MTEQRLNVAVPAESTQYEIVIGRDNISKLADGMKQLALGKKVLIVTDDNVNTLYGKLVSEGLTQAGFNTQIISVPAGEESKTLNYATQIYEQAVQFNLTRKDTILALGGGVVGDLAGYCAATYMRGTKFVQVPTTLLAQVDSSVGGKVAVNLPELKNGIGCFYQPELVWMDLAMLETLPEREFLAGLAEVVKYTLIETSCADTSGMFVWLKNNANDLKSILPELVYRCCEIKAAVVAKDERDEKGMRAFLNLGHTFAHAYEEITHYKTYLHGEAVAIGMIDALRLSVEKKLIVPEALDDVLMLYSQLGLPSKPKETYDHQKMRALMSRDKKNTGNGIKFVLPKGSIGQVVLVDD